MSQPNEPEHLTKKDLRAARWEKAVAWPYGTFWSHPAVRDGQPMSFREAVHAEVVRRKSDGG